MIAKKSRQKPCHIISICPANANRFRIRPIYRKVAGKAGVDSLSVGKGVRTLFCKKES
jgi:hypothetical protein